MLDSLGDDQPPAAVLDIARLGDGRFILLEANQAWGAGLYGCDSDLALKAVLVANGADGADRTESDRRWSWKPDPALYPAPVEQPG